MRDGVRADRGPGWVPRSDSKSAIVGWCGKVEDGIADLTVIEYDITTPAVGHWPSSRFQRDLGLRVAMMRWLDKGVAGEDFGLCLASTYARMRWMTDSVISYKT
jgi:hypothetical protein